MDYKVGLNDVRVSRSLILFLNVSSYFFPRGIIEHPGRGVHTLECSNTYEDILDDLRVILVSLDAPLNSLRHDLVLVHYPVKLGTIETLCVVDLR